MDWDRVIDKNRAAPTRVVAALAAMTRLGGSTSPLVERMVRLGEAKPRR